MLAFELIAIEKENTNDVLRSIAKGLRKKYNLNHSGVYGVGLHSRIIYNLKTFVHKLIPGFPLLLLEEN